MSDDLLVRKLGADVKQRLRARASRHGRSLAAEAREILRAASAQPAARRPPAPTTNQPEEGFGTRVARLFAGIGLTEDEVAMINGLRSCPADFSSDE